MKHECVHDLVSARSTPHVAAGTAVETAFAPLRIRVDTGFLERDVSACEQAGQRVQLGNATVVCTGDDVLTVAKRRVLLDEVLVRATAWLEATLNVRRSVGPLRITAPRVSVPEKQLSAITSTCLALSARRASRTVSLETHWVRLSGRASTGSQKPLSASASSQPWPA